MQPLSSLQVPPSGCWGRGELLASALGWGPERRSPPTPPLRVLGWVWATVLASCFPSGLPHCPGPFGAMPGCPLPTSAMGWESPRVSVSLDTRWGKTQPCRGLSVTLWEPKPEVSLQRLLFCVHSLSPHLCTVPLSLPQCDDEIGHDHEGAVPLEGSYGGEGWEDSLASMGPSSRWNIWKPLPSTGFEWADGTRLLLPLMQLGEARLGWPCPLQRLVRVQGGRVCSLPVLGRRSRPHPRPEHWSLGMGSRPGP